MTPGGAPRPGDPSGFEPPVGAKATTLAAKLDELAHELQERRADADRLHRASEDLAASRRREVQLAERLRRLETQVVALAPQPADREVAGLRGQLSAIETRLAVMESLAAEIQGLRRGVRQQLDQATNRMQGRERDMVRLAEQIARLGEQVGGVERRVVEMEAKLADVGPLAAELPAVRRAARQDAERLAAEIESRDAALQTRVRAEAERAAAVADRQASSLRDLAASVAALEERVAPVESLKAEIAGVRRGVGHELELALERAADRAGQVERRIEAFEGRVAEVDRLRADLDAVSARARSHDGAVARLVAGLTALHDRMRALEPMAAEMEQGVVVLAEVRAAERRAAEAVASLAARVSAIERWATRATRSRAQAAGPTATPVPAGDGVPSRPAPPG